MKLDTKVTLIIGIVVILAVGFIGFQGLQVEPPEAEMIYKTVTPERRQITTSQFIERTSEPVSQSQHEASSIESPEIETVPVPETVPTAHSTDDEIREFQEWLSSVLVKEEMLEEIEQKDFDPEDDHIDYELERSHIKSVIEDQWKNSLEAYDIDGYMSAIWEDSFFYASDMGTPDDLNDDLIFRSGTQEREGTLKMFNATQDIDLNLYRSGDIEFLSDTLAMVDYDYNLRLDYTQHGVSYPSGRMIFILELRDSGEWRILEWYDYATPDPNR